MNEQRMTSPQVRSPPSEVARNQPVTLSGRLATQDMMARAANMPIDMYRARTRDEWKALLGRERYLVMRYRKFEHPLSGPYSNFTRESCEEDGLFVCFACKWVLFDLEQFEGTHSGWPSFSSHLGEQVVKAYGDSQHGGIPFFEYFCAHCEGFLGRSMHTGGANTIQISGYAIELRKMSPEEKRKKLVELEIISAGPVGGGKMARAASLKDIVRGSSKSSASGRQDSAEKKSVPPVQTSGILPHKFSGGLRSPESGARTSSKGIGKMSLQTAGGATSPNADAPKAPASKKGLFSPRQASRESKVSKF